MPLLFLSTNRQALLSSLSRWRCWLSLLNRGFVVAPEINAMEREQ